MRRAHGAETTADPIALPQKLHLIGKIWGSVRHGGYEPLKRVVSPFVLRRLKTDRCVIPDLPDKIEMKSFAALT